MKKYNFILPIGDNCEPAAHLVRNGWTQSSIFRYARSELSQVVELIESDFQDVFSFDAIKPVNKQMATCLKYGISWHTNLDIELGSDGFWSFKNKDIDKYKADISKISALIKSFKSALEEKNSNLLFVYKSNKGYFDHILKFICLIETKYPNVDFKVLVVKTKAQSIQINHERLDVSNVSLLAPYDNAILGGDDKGWNLTFSNYFDTPKYEEIAFKTFSPKGGGTADYLRDIAIKFEEIGDIRTAYKLMEQASLCRPDGLFIKKKLATYKAKLSL